MSVFHLSSRLLDQNLTTHLDPSADTRSGAFTSTERAMDGSGLGMYERDVKRAALVLALAAGFGALLLVGHAGSKSSAQAAVKRVAGNTIDAAHRGSR
jgi:hypothetical protein